MPTPSFRLPPATRIGAVHLRISNLNESLAFYGGLLGLKEVGRDGKTVHLSASGQQPDILRLTESETQKPRSRRSPGLYHLATRVPRRAELANVIKELNSAKWPLYGFANHGVSESVYLADPDGNGIEIYADLPRERWPHDGNHLAMTADPLNLDDFLKLADGKWQGLHPETVIGHVHLQVSDLTKAREFYHDLLGFDITQESFPGALFFAAGGYHHHVATNTWASLGGSPAPEGSNGLVAFEILLPDEETLSTVRNRLEAAGVRTGSAQEDHLSGITAYDRDNIRVELLAHSS